jgi:iron complex transport system ATP-binding protein
VTLVAREVVVRRGDRTTLDRVSVTVASSDLTAVVGPNGSGKSTLLRVLAGLWKPADGDVTLDGHALGAWTRRDIARRVAFLPQDTRCDFAFTVEEVVAMGRHPHRGRFERGIDADHRAIESAMVRCDLDGLRGRTLDTLSGGERQRVCVARCLATTPDVLLLDEPTAHLDLEHALRLLTLCRTLADAGHAVAIATHDLALIRHFATRAVVLRSGRLVGHGLAEDALTPSVCRTVFGVDAEVATTPGGRSTFLFRTFDGESQ